MPGELFNSYLNNIFRERGDEWIDEKFGNLSENLDSERTPITKSERTWFLPNLQCRKFPKLPLCPAML
jgi:hypothetical protein